MKYDYFPSCSYLSSSLKERSKECFLESNVHGVRYFADPTRPKWERIVWLTLTAVSTFTAVGIIILCWARYNQDPTLTGIEIDTNLILVDFPQIQLCYNSKHLNFSTLNKEQIWVLTQLYDWRWGESIELPPMQSKKTTTFTRIMLRRGPNCSAVLQDCFFRGVEKPCGEFVQKVVTPAGVCCRFPSDVITINDFPWAFEFTPTVYPVRLYLLDKFDSGPMRLERPVEELMGPTSIAFGAQITNPSNDLKYLTKSQRECHYHYESSSFNDCQLDCMAKYLVAKCNCLPWFFNRTDRKECQIVDYPCLNIQELDLTTCRCSISCQSTTYMVKKIEAQEEGKSCIVEMPIWPKGLYQRGVRFGFLDVLVSSGGIASLFIGYSVLTTVELGYYLSLRAYCGAVLDSTHSKVNIIRVRVPGVKPPRKIVVQPVYEYID